MKAMLSLCGQPTQQILLTYQNLWLSAYERLPPDFQVRCSFVFSHTFWLMLFPCFLPSCSAPSFPECLRYHDRHCKKQERNSSCASSPRTPDWWVSEDGRVQCIDFKNNVKKKKCPAGGQTEACQTLVQVQLCISSLRGRC